MSLPRKVRIILHTAQAFCAVAACAFAWQMHGWRSIVLFWACTEAAVYKVTQVTDDAGGA